MKKISLGNDAYALVDDDDYDAVMRSGPWHISGGDGPFYALHSVSPSKKIRMHHLITGHDYVDHINGDGLDNRRCNLRPATHSQNHGNRGRNKNNTSGFKGVTRLPSGRFRAMIADFGLGTFDTAAEAARAYDEAAVARWGEFARTNAQIQHEERLDREAEGEQTAA